MAKSNKEFVKFIKDCGVNKSVVYDVRNKYFSPTGFPTKAMRQSYIGYCSKLITDMSLNGATNEELEKAIIFSIVVLDSIKCRLSLTKAKDDLDILELQKKYCNNNKAVNGNN